MEIDESLFKKLIEIEFLRDLRYAESLSSVSYYNRTSNQNFLWMFLRGKYRPDEKCPSILYLHISKPLRRKYNIIHRRILEILH